MPVGHEYIKLKNTISHYLSKSKLHDYKYLQQTKEKHDKNLSMNLLFSLAHRPDPKSNSPHTRLQLPSPNSRLLLIPHPSQRLCAILDHLAQVQVRLADLLGHILWLTRAFTSFIRHSRWK
jgi:hypothetical protein